MKKERGRTPKMLSGNILSFEYKGSQEKDSTQAGCVVWYKEWEERVLDWIAYWDFLEVGFVDLS